MQRLASRRAAISRGILASCNSLFSLPEIVQTELVSLRDFAFKAPAHTTTHSRWSHAAATAPAAASPADRTLILDGRAVAAAWQDELASQVAAARTSGARPPGLAVVLVGDRPDSALYVARKREACARVGVHSSLLHLPARVTQEELRHAVRALCADPAVDGVLVQLPLPPGIDEEDIVEHFDPGKDVDGFHPLNVGRTLMRGRAARFVPCTALGCVELLRRSGVSVAGRSVVIAGDSNIVGMPLAMLFRDAGAATVTVVHRSSYAGLFAAPGAESAEHRAQAAACLPRVPPGPARPPQPYEVSYVSLQQRAKRTHQTDAPPPAPPPPHLAELASMTRTADILVVAVGFPQLVKRDWIKPGAVVVDVGINVVDWAVQNEGGGTGGGGKREEQQPAAFHVVGDVDFAEAVGVAAAVTPVPGGVGPMTISALLHNTVAAWAAKVAAGSDSV